MLERGQTSGDGACARSCGTIAAWVLAGHRVRVQDGYETRRYRMPSASCVDRCVAASVCPPGCSGPDPTRAPYVGTWPIPPDGEICTRSCLSKALWTTYATSSTAPNWYGCGTRCTCHPGSARRGSRSSTPRARQPECMPLDPLQDRIARTALALPEASTLALAGGGAMIAHGFVNRVTKDIDLFTEIDDQEALQVTAALRDVLQQQGLVIRDAERQPTDHRFTRGRSRQRRRMHCRGLSRRRAAASPRHPR